MVVQARDDGSAPGVDDLLTWLRRQVIGHLDDLLANPKVDGCRRAVTPAESAWGETSFGDQTVDGGIIRTEPRRC